MNDVEAIAAEDRVVPRSAVDDIIPRAAIKQAADSSRDEEVTATVAVEIDRCSGSRVACAAAQDHQLVVSVTRANCDRHRQHGADVEPIGTRSTGPDDRGHVAEELTISERRKPDFPGAITRTDVEDFVRAAARQVQSQHAVRNRCVEIREVLEGLPDVRDVKFDREEVEPNVDDREAEDRNADTQFDIDVRTHLDIEAAIVDRVVGVEIELLSADAIVEIAVVWIVQVPNLSKEDNRLDADLQPNNRRIEDDLHTQPDTTNDLGFIQIGI